MIIGYRSQNHPQQISRRGSLAEVDDRRTPPDLLAECMGLAGVTRFDLDVAATADNTKAKAFYAIDAAGGGLFWPWYGRVWCNPPYSQCAAWVATANDEAPRCELIAMLLPANRTEQKWWQELVEPTRDYHGTVDRFTLDVHFLAGRRRFDRPGWTKPAKGDRPPFGLCLVVWS